MGKIQSVKHAKEIIAELEKSIQEILEPFAVSDVDDWLEKHSSSNEYKDVKKQLLTMDQELVDANLFLRHSVTMLKFE